MRCSQLRLLLLASLLAFTSLQHEKPAQAQDTTIPALTYSDRKQQVLVPNWSRITWDSLPPIEESGWIQVPKNLVTEIGYNPSRVWKAGQTPDSFTMLGDIDEFYLEAFKLNDISGLTDLAMNSLNLNDFGLTKWQTPSSLVKAIPQLGDLSISAVLPIRDLLSKVGAADWNEKISTIAQDKRLGNLELGKYIDLSKYSINSIPGLTQTPIGKFKAWQQSFISQVPGLSQVPFSQFPIPFASGGMSFAYTDLVWSSAEHGDSQVPSSYFISGTIDKKDRTVPVPCKAGEQCSYIELSDPVGESQYFLVKY